MKRRSHIVLVPPLLDPVEHEGQPRDPSFTVYQKALLAFFADRLRCLPEVEVFVPTVTGMFASVPVPEEAASLKHLPYKTNRHALLRSIMEELGSGDHHVGLILRSEACFVPLDIVEQALLLLHAYEDGAVLGWNCLDDSYLLGFRRPHASMLAGAEPDPFTAQLTLACTLPCSLFILRSWRCLNTDFHYGLTRIGFHPDTEILEESDLPSLVLHFQDRHEPDPR